MSLRDLSQPVSELSHTVAGTDIGARLDHVLGNWITWRSRTDMQERIRNGTVKINGKPSKASRKLQPGDVITVCVIADAPPPADASSMALVILHEEATFLVIDKAPGTVIHPVGNYVMDTLMNVLHARYRRPDSATDDVIPMVVHRLDRDTSGVLVVALGEESRRYLGAAFESRAVTKEYLALVHGRVEKDTFTIDLPIGPAATLERTTRMACEPGGKPSRTAVAVVERFASATLVRCEPHTGRQHQIRVHLSAVGHPILADQIYGIPPASGQVTAGELGVTSVPADTVLLSRQALHASRLVIPHPLTHLPVAFTAPLASDMEGLVKLLRGG